MVWKLTFEPSSINLINMCVIEEKLKMFCFSLNIVSVYVGELFYDYHLLDQKASDCISYYVPYAAGYNAQTFKLHSMFIQRLRCYFNKYISEHLPNIN